MSYCRKNLCSDRLMSIIPCKQITTDKIRLPRINRRKQDLKTVLKEMEKLSRPRFKQMKCTNYTPVPILPKDNLGQHPLPQVAPPPVTNPVAPNMLVQGMLPANNPNILQTAFVNGPLNTLNYQQPASTIGQLNPVNLQPSPMQINPINYQPVNALLNANPLPNPWVLLQPVLNVLPLQPLYNYGLISSTNNMISQQSQGSMTAEASLYAENQFSYNTPFVDSCNNQTNNPVTSLEGGIKQEATTTIDSHTPANNSDATFQEQMKHNIEQIRHDPIEIQCSVKSETNEFISSSCKTSDANDNNLKIESTQTESHELNLVLESIVSLADHCRSVNDKNDFKLTEERSYLVNKFHRTLNLNGVKNGEHFTDLKLFTPSYVVLESMTVGEHGEYRNKLCSPKCKQKVVNKLCTKRNTRTTEKGRKRHIIRDKRKTVFDRHTQDDLRRHRHLSEHSLENTIRKILQQLLYYKIFKHFTGIRYFLLPNRIKDLVMLFPKVTCDNGTNSYLITIENKFILINDNEIQNENLCHIIVKRLQQNAYEITGERYKEHCDTFSESDAMESDSSEDDDDYVIVVDENREWRKVKTLPNGVQKKTVESRRLGLLFVFNGCDSSSETIANESASILTSGNSKNSTPVCHSNFPSHHSNPTDEGIENMFSNSDDQIRLIEMNTHYSRDSDQWYDVSDMSDSDDESTTSFQCNGTQIPGGSYKEKQLACDSQTFLGVKVSSEQSTHNRIEYPNPMHATVDNAWVETLVKRIRDLKKDFKEIFQYINEKKEIHC